MGVRKPTSDEKFSLHQDLVQCTKVVHFILFVLKLWTGFGFLLIKVENEKKVFFYIWSLIFKTFDKYDSISKYLR